MKILLAEDDFVTRKFMANFLSKYGDCDVTVDGMEAVDAFMLALEEDEPYDLVCLDIMMPVMDGYQALMGIRNIEKERNIPEDKQVKVIMATATATTTSTTKRTFCPAKTVPVSISSAMVNIVSVLFILRSEDPPIIAIFTE